MKLRIVALERSIPNADIVRGQLVMSSAEWIVVNRLDDSVFFDGYVAIRASDVVAFRDSGTRTSRIPGNETAMVEAVRHPGTSPAACFEKHPGRAPSGGT